MTLLVVSSPIARPTLCKIRLKLSDQIDADLRARKQAKRGDGLRSHPEELEQQMPVGVLERQAADVLEGMERNFSRKVPRQDLRDDASIRQVSARQTQRVSARHHSNTAQAARWAVEPSQARLLGFLMSIESSSVCSQAETSGLSAFAIELRTLMFEVSATYRSDHSTFKILKNRGLYTIRSKTSRINNG